MFANDTGGFYGSVELAGHELLQLSINSSSNLGVLFGTICNTDSPHFVMSGHSTQTVHLIMVSLTTVSCMIFVDRHYVIICSMDCA